MIHINNISNTKNNNNRSCIVYALYSIFKIHVHILVLSFALRKGCHLACFQARLKIHSHGWYVEGVFVAVHKLDCTGGRKHPIVSTVCMRHGRHYVQAKRSVWFHVPE